MKRSDRIRRAVDRRSFLAAAAGAATAALAPSAFAALRDANALAGARSHSDLANDESYWSQIQRAFDVDRTMVNLNNGGVSPAPAHVLDHLVRDLKFVNGLPAEHNWRVLEPRMESVRRELAREFGCDPEEMAVVRNASEAMETLILGLDMKPGDEAVVTDQNYPRMLSAWAQRERRDGIKVRRVSFPVPLEDPEPLLRAIESSLNDRTRAIELPHVINYTGQIMPIREVSVLAQSRGIPLFVDGAHAFAHIPFSRDDLDCDYYGTSLHKWLHAPIGAGFLYVRRDRIPGIWPLMAAEASQDADIRKFEQTGTRPQANYNAVAVALAFHRGIGIQRKLERLRYLRDRWATALLQDSDRVRVLPFHGPGRSGALALLSVDGMDPKKLGAWLLSARRIVTTLIEHAAFSGLRITPSVYTTPSEIDAFAEAVAGAIRHGLPS